MVIYCSECNTKLQIIDKNREEDEWGFYSVDDVEVTLCLNCTKKYIEKIEKLEERIEELEHQLDRIAWGEN